MDRETGGASDRSLGYSDVPLVGDMGDRVGLGEAADRYGGVAGHPDHFLRTTYHAAAAVYRKFVLENGKFRGGLGCR